MFFSKVINWKRNVKHLLLRKTDAFETCRTSKFLGENIWRNALALKSYKGTRYIRRNSYFGIIVLSCLSSREPCLKFLLVYVEREIKGFYQSSLGNHVDFRDIMNVSPNILAKNFKKLNFKKLKHGFVDE